MAVHEELITALKFDEKFKNALRDYYSYGFKTLHDYKNKSARETARKDWDRLNRILADHKYMEWAGDASQILFVSADSQAMRENPFQSVYRFCDNRHTDFFISAMAALSGEFRPAFLNKKFIYRLIGQTKLSERDKMELRVYLGDAGNKKEFLNDMKTVEGGLDAPSGSYRHPNPENTPRNREFSLLRAAVEGSVSPFCLKASELWGEDSNEPSTSSDDSRNKKVNERMESLAALGIVNVRQSAGDKHASGDHYYSLSELTMKELLRRGRAADADFYTHLRSALDFYSRYYAFGEAGVFLLDRLDADDFSPFRFKHEYFMQALNDFNLIDLLSAMEEGLWCRIVWKRGKNGRRRETLAFPLEVRVSSDTGRETLFYYDAPERSVEALRLEFIDEIYIYRDSEVRGKLSEISEEVYLSSTEIDSDIEKARLRLKTTWGTSLARGREKNLIQDQPLHTVRMRLRIDPLTQEYMIRRIVRECRTGKVSVSEDNSTLFFEARVCDQAEIRPWIRSFYSRVVSCEGMNDEDFSFEADVERMAQALITPLPDNKAGSMAFTEETAATDDRPDLCSLLGPGEKARAHEQIFNEIFSVYDAVSADVYVRLAGGEESGEPGAFTVEQLDHAIKNALGRYFLKIGQETEYILPDEIKGWIFSDDILLTDDGERSEKVPRTGDERVYRLKYHCKKGVDFYRDVVPLTLFERRWLKTVLGDGKIRYFLTDEEISAVCAFLDSDMGAGEHDGADPAAISGQVLADTAPARIRRQELPMEKIVAFDRFSFPEAGREKEACFMGVLLRGIYESQVLNLVYGSNRGRTLSGSFKPAAIEYSKRNDRFQAYMLSCRDNRIYIMNLSQIRQLSLTEQAFDSEETEEALERFRERNERSVTIYFYNSRRLMDRVLTEFSPWRKRCSYDKETGIYTLTLFYQEQDETEMVIRLMGFGPYIRFKDRENPIYLEIRNRVERQRDLNRERRRQREEREL